jgi:glycosyltransferase involved in cell wall biosynthesis
MPKISVIMPVYNGEKTVTRSISSVLEQTFSDFELIVVNDGSTDNSLHLINAFADKRIRVLSQDNSGASAARNLGIKMSQGDYLAFLDVDDRWSKDKLEDQIKMFSESSEVGLVYSWSDYVDEKGDLLCSGKRLVINSNFNKEDVYQKLLISNFLENGSTPLIRRDVMLTIGGFDESLKSAQDLDVYLKIAINYEFRTVPKVQVFYSIMPNSITANSTKSEKHRIEFLKSVFSRSPKKFQHLKKKSISSVYRNLLLRILEGRLSPEQGFRAIKYAFFWIANNPSCLRYEWRLLVVSLIKVSAAFVPKRLSACVLSKTKRNNHFLS